jgi:hypothetical protein
MTRSVTLASGQQFGPHPARGQPALSPAHRLNEVIMTVEEVFADPATRALLDRAPLMRLASPTATSKPIAAP